MKTPECLICGKPVPDYEPKYCCSQACGCLGIPINPCSCSVRCERAIFKYIGKTYEDRRRLAKIKKHIQGVH